MAYHLKGRLLEVCDCDILCPCWVGEDPDNGTCDAVVAWHVDGGHIDDVDVTGLTVAWVDHLPGNVLDGNIRTLIYVSEEASAEQEAALVNAWTGGRDDLAGRLRLLHNPRLTSLGGQGIQVPTHDGRRWPAGSRSAGT